MHKFSHFLSIGPKVYLLVLSGLGTMVGGASATVPSTEAPTIFVDLAAAEGGDGSAKAPWKTLEQAAAQARTIPDQPVRVVIAPGHYLVRHGFFLGPEDSRPSHAPAIYEASQPGTVRISSGILLSPEQLRPVTDETILRRLPEASRNQVREVSLDDLGIKVTRFPDRFRGLELLEVFWEEKRLPMSRWPEPGKFAAIEKVLDNGLGTTGGVFVYRGEVPARWVEAVEDGLWLRGFWRVPWSIEAVRVGEINPQERTITHAVPIPNGIGSKYHRAPGNGPGAGSGQEPWEAVNLLEEIDLPGEWAVRFPTRMLYLFPPEEPGSLLLTDVRDPVVALEQVSHTTLTGLQVDSGLGDGIRIKGGENVMVAGCQVSRVSRDGISIQGGKNHTVLSCDITETGFSGISFLGGERSTLTPGGHRIINNLVSKAGLYFPAAGILGGGGPRAESVGNLVAHNRIHDSANSGIVYAGNENRFEYNEIYRIGLGSSDLGCFYTNSGWTSRGNLIQFNFVHHSMNANAFYVDDGDAGDTFFGNVAYRTQSGAFIGGGHDQVFRNNVMVENLRAVHVDARGIARGYTRDDARLRGDLESVPFLESPWKERYPQLLDLLDRNPEVPSGLLVEENLFVACEMPLRKANKDEQLVGFTFRHNFVSDDLNLFTDVAALDFSLRPGTALFEILPDFVNIPMAKIGLYPDAYRPKVPPRDLELLRTGNTAGGGFDSLIDVEATNRPAGH